MNDKVSAQIPPTLNLPNKMSGQLETESAQKKRKSSHVHICNLCKLNHQVEPARSNRILKSSRRFLSTTHYAVALIPRLFTAVPDRKAEPSQSKIGLHVDKRFNLSTTNPPKQISLSECHGSFSVRWAD